MYGTFLAEFLLFFTHLYIFLVNFKSFSFPIYKKSSENIIFQKRSIEIYLSSARNMEYV